MKVPRTAASLLESLRPYLASRFGSDAGSATLSPLHGALDAVKEGCYGVPWLVTWSTPEGPRRVVLETVRPGGFGHEDRADRAGLVVRAFDDYGRLPGHVKPADFGVFREAGPAISLAGTSEFFFLTEFCEGTPYALDLERISVSGELEERDLGRARNLADYLVDIHRTPVAHPTYYRRRLRDLGGYGECVAGVADSEPESSAHLPAELLHRIEAGVLAWRYRLRHRSDRLRAIHGDFHPWNILFAKDGSFHALDRSRGTYGEPADDVAALSISYVFFALRTTGHMTGPFARLFDVFWHRYLEQSGDRELPLVIAPFYAFRALVLASTVWYPDEAAETRRRLVALILAVLEAPRFSPGCIEEWTSGTPHPSPEEENP